MKIVTSTNCVRARGVRRSDDHYVVKKHHHAATKDNRDKFSSISRTAVLSQPRISTAPAKLRGWLWGTFCRIRFLALFESV